MTLRPAGRSGSQGLPFRRGAAIGVAAAATLGIALASAALLLAPATVAVPAIANVFLAGRSMAAEGPARRFAQLPVTAALIVLAGAFGRLLGEAPPLGALLLSLAIGGAVWARRFGPRGRAIARLAAAPFVAVLVVPVPVPLSAGPGAVLLVPALAVLGQLACATSLSAFRVRAAPAASAPERSRTSSGRRLRPTTRQAVQAVVGLLAGFGVGFLVFGRHWPWVVITVFVVQIGARGRGDALAKAVLRVGGAAVGTVLGMAVAALPLAATGRVVLILLVLTCASVLRDRGYAWWAAGVTTALALLYGLLGAGTIADLVPRLLAVVVGGVVAVAASWFVLPIRSADVLRGRVADLLAALQGLLHALREAPDRVPEALAAVAAASARVEEVAPAHRLHARVRRLTRRDPSRGARVIGAIEEVDAAARAIAAAPPDRGLGALARQIGALRRRNARRPDVPRPEPAPGPLGGALDRLWDALD